MSKDEETVFKDISTVGFYRCNKKYQWNFDKIIIGTKIDRKMIKDKKKQIIKLLYWKMT